MALTGLGELQNMSTVANGWLAKLRGMPFMNELQTAVNSWTMEAAMFASETELKTESQPPEDTDWRYMTERFTQNWQDLHMEWMRFSDLVRRATDSRTRGPPAESLEISESVDEQVVGAVAADV